ncbi:hypothetical protein ACFWIQ_01950 [Kitasatospora sp. NPDC127059]|uniref:hypothetical protein n=1 Tax=unclassified Kitasatospora TaxID=2633591 RepID=UPI00365A6F68
MGMGGKGDTHNEISHNEVSNSTIRSLIQANRVVQVIVKGPLVVLTVVMALVTAGATYLVLRAGGDTGPQLSARYELGDPAVDIPTIVPGTLSPTDFPVSVTDCVPARAWLHGRGGVDVGTSRLVVEATGGKGHVVAIESLRAVVVATAPDPLTGTTAHCHHEGVGSKVDLGVDLDSPGREALIGSNDGSLSYAPFFSGKYLYLEDQKPELINLSVISARKTYDYVLAVEGTVDGKRRTWTLKDGDRPFRVTGSRDDYGVDLRSAGHSWATDYRRRTDGPTRCNPCQNDDHSIVPGTTVPGAPTDPAPDPTAAPATRPGTQPAPPALAPDDAESVALAWAVAANSLDVKRDAAAPAVLPRLRKYLTPAFAASTATTGGLPGAGRTAWPAEAIRHQARSEVTGVLVTPTDPHAGPDALRQEVVKVHASVEVSCHADDGWSWSGDGPYDGELVLRRQSGGGYLVDAFQPGWGQLL